METPQHGIPSEQPLLTNLLACTRLDSGPRFEYLLLSHLETTQLVITWIKSFWGGWINGFFQHFVGAERLPTPQSLTASLPLKMMVGR